MMTFNTPTHLLIACSLPLLSGVALAKNDGTEQVLVTATRSTQAIAHNLSAATVFTREDIERLQIKSLQELLSKTSGLTTTRTGGRGATTGIVMRGNQSDHTLFLIDGVRVGSATLGSTSVEMIDPELIERVEIVKGPKSSLYGSDALGGVINIITRKASASQPLQFKAGVGNNNTKESSINTGHHSENFNINLTASYFDTDGIDNTQAKNDTNGDKDSFEEKSLALSAAATPIDSLELSLNYQRNHGESDFDGNCSENNTYLPIVCSPYTENQIESLGINGKWEATQLWTTSLAYGYSSDDSKTIAKNDAAAITTIDGKFTTKRNSASWLNDLRFSENVLLTLGYDFLEENVESSTTTYEVEERYNHGYFAQAQALAGDFSFNLGARRDDNEQFGQFDTYNAATGYTLTTNLTLVATYAEAFKAPTFNDLYFPDFGDPKMIPEETDAHEISLRGNHYGVAWSLNAYQNNIENLIQYDSNTGTNTQLSSATIEGLELDLKGDVYGWHYQAAFSALSTEDDNTGNDLARRPSKSASLDIDRSFGPWSIGTTLYASGRSYDDADNTTELNGYATVALRGSYQAHKDWKLQLKANNLFEKEYYTAKSSSFENLGFYQQPGLEVLFSVVYTPSF